MIVSNCPSRCVAVVVGSNGNPKTTAENAVMSQLICANRSNAIRQYAGR
jgi:hypothetical protein